MDFSPCDVILVRGLFMDIQFLEILLDGLPALFREKGEKPEGTGASAPRSFDHNCATGSLVTVTTCRVALRM